MSECQYLHALCSHGCSKYVCRSHFPASQPIIIEATLELCRSAEHGECTRFVEGVAFQQERRDSHKGCPFLSNNLCGNPDVYLCKGGNYPSLLKGKYMGREANEDITPCLSNEFDDCPEYMKGLQLQDLARRIKEERELKEQAEPTTR